MAKEEIDKIIYALNGLTDIVRGYESLRTKTAFTVLIGSETVSKIENDTISRFKGALIGLLKDLGVDTKTYSNTPPYGQVDPDQTASENTNAAHAETSTPSPEQPSALAWSSTPVPPETSALRKPRRWFW